MMSFTLGRIQDNNPDKRVFLSVMPYQNRSAWLATYVAKYIIMFVQL